jgi:hypothetical protein
VVTATDVATVTEAELIQAYPAITAPAVAMELCAAAPPTATQPAIAEASSIVNTLLSPLHLSGAGGIFSSFYGSVMPNKNLWSIYQRI